MTGQHTRFISPPFSTVEQIISLSLFQAAPFRHTKSHRRNQTDTNNITHLQRERARKTHAQHTNSAQKTKQTSTACIQTNEHKHARTQSTRTIYVLHTHTKQTDSIATVHTHVCKPTNGARQRQSIYHVLSHGHTPFIWK